MYENNKTRNEMQYKSRAPFLYSTSRAPVIARLVKFRIQELTGESIYRTVEGEYNVSKHTEQSSN